MTVDPKDNAFPIFNREGEVYFSQSGLTKREYFAALAMQGILANDLGQPSYNAVATMAVLSADALIAALNGEGQSDG